MRCLVADWSMEPVHGRETSQCVRWARLQEWRVRPLKGYPVKAESCFVLDGGLQSNDAGQRQGSLEGLLSRRGCGGKEMKEWEEALGYWCNGRGKHRKYRFCEQACMRKLVLCRGGW
jgi:hypothetical protein